GEVLLPRGNSIPNRKSKTEKAKGFAILSYLGATDLHVAEARWRLLVGLLPPGEQYAITKQLGAPGEISSAAQRRRCRSSRPGRRNDSETRMIPHSRLAKTNSKLGPYSQLKADFPHISQRIANAQHFREQRNK